MNSNPLFPNFEAACSAVLEYLHQKFGFRLWMVTRKDGSDWIVLFSEDHGYNVKPGDIFCWADSFCSRMVQGKGPRIAPDSQSIPAYREAPIGSKVPIQAYIGIPLNRGDGTLFGTLCAIDPDPKPNEIVLEQPLFELLASMLSSILETELNNIEQSRRVERASAEAVTDPLTGLLNRRGWETLAAKEEERMRRYGHTAGVLYIDVDNLKRINDSEGHKAGDRIIRKTADLLKTTTRESDLVARIGGDEFVILAVESDARTCFTMIERINQRFNDEGISISIGYGTKTPANSIEEAVAIADEDMYRQKQAAHEAVANCNQERQLRI